MGLTLDDFCRLQNLLIENPLTGPVVKSAGGLRKMRFSPIGGGRGKRGACRVCYAYFPEAGTILFVLVYRKNEKIDLSPSDRKLASAIVRAIEKRLQRSDDDTESD